MDTTDPEITFDQAGRCVHCVDYVERRAKHKYHGAESDTEWDRIAAEISASGRGREYDCVIGVSGGVDSSYLAYIATQKGLRPLAVHMDNGWNSEKAVQNIKNITDKLGIDYESFVLDWEEFKDLQLAFLRASVPEAETPTDVAIPAAIHLVAARHGVKYILNGGNITTEGILPKSWHYNVKDLKYFNHIQKKFGRKRLKSFPTFGYKREAYYKLVKGMRIVYPLNLVSFVKSDATKLMQEEFGWRSYGGKHHESGYTKFIQSYYLYEKFGIDYRRAGLSVQICNGETSREAALLELESLPYDPATIEAEKGYVAKKLGVPRDEFDEILNLPPRWYSDYPNDQKMLGMIYDVYRLVFKKEKLDRF